MQPVCGLSTAQAKALKEMVKKRLGMKRLSTNSYEDVRMPPL